MNYEEQIQKLQLENIHLKVLLQSLMKDLRHIDNFANNLLKISGESKEKINEFLEKEVREEENTTLN